MGGQVRFGYKTTRTIRLLNTVVKYLFVLLMALASIPLLLTIAVIMKVFNPGPLLYSGARLGKAEV